jgi:hypothetical protein
MRGAALKDGATFACGEHARQRGSSISVLMLHRACLHDCRLGLHGAIARSDPPHAVIPGSLEASTA